MEPEERLTKEELEFQNNLINKMQEAVYARRAWEEHLGKKYDLSEEDGVTSDGVIKRGVNKKSNSEEPVD